MTKWEQRNVLTEALYTMGDPVFNRSLGTPGVTLIRAIKDGAIIMEGVIPFTLVGRNVERLLTQDQAVRYMIHGDLEAEKIIKECEAKEKSEIESAIKYGTRPPFSPYKPMGHGALMSQEYVQSVLNHEFIQKERQGKYVPISNCPMPDLYIKQYDDKPAIKDLVIAPKSARV